MQQAPSPIRYTTVIVSVRQYRYAHAVLLGGVHTQYKHYLTLRRVTACTSPSLITYGETEMSRPSEVVVIRDLFVKEKLAQNCLENEGATALKY